MNHIDIRGLKRAAEQKSVLVFDFDQTIAKIIIEWAGWHSKIVEVFRQFEPDFPYSYGENVFPITNEMIKKYGEEMRVKLNEVSSEYEMENAEGLIVNEILVDYIRGDSREKHIYSSNSKELLKKFLRELEINSLFEKIISRDDVPYIKPDPSGFEIIYDPDKDKSDYIMVGDSSSDKEVANAFGIDYFYMNIVQ